VFTILLGRSPADKQAGENLSFRCPVVKVFYWGEQQNVFSGSLFRALPGGPPGEEVQPGGAVAAQEYRQAHLPVLQGLREEAREDGL